MVVESRLRLKRKRHCDRILDAAIVKSAKHHVRRYTLLTHCDLVDGTLALEKEPL